MNIKRNALLAVIGLAMAGTAVTGASAETLHPRREQVNERSVHQMHRIHEARREGEIGGRKAWRLEKAEYRVQAQEHRMAYRHHGHITRAEQARLNHEQNRINRHIRS